MYYDFKVKIPKVKGKIYERTIKGVVYINYEYDRIYKPDKKYNIPKRTTIGKKCEDDPEMMYPNPNFLTYFPDAELPEDQGRDARSSCLRIGTWIVIEKLMVESLLDKIISGLYGNDRGTQYRTGIYYTDKADLPLIEAVMHEQQKHFNKPLEVEVSPLKNFYPAEDYHQDYLDKNPTGYCHLPQSLFEMARKAKMK